jgi:gas vesicle protein
MMDEASQRFDMLLKKPILMIEKQMDQQRYMFEEAHKQKDFLERMFGELLNDQRSELTKLFAEQSYRLKELIEINQKANYETQERISHLESEILDKFKRLEMQIESQQKTNS